MERIFRTAKQERISFALFMAGQAMYNSTAGYVQVFFTNMGITAFAVGIIFLVARIWDAVNDPMFGGIVDRVNLKGGKFLPWLKLSTYLLPVFMFLIFLMPSSLSPAVKIIWAGAAYILYGMAYTICDVPIFSMTSAVTDQVHERVFIMSANTILAGVMMLAVTVIIPLLYTSIGWTLTSVIIFIPAFLFMFSFNRNGKERYVNKDSEKITLKVMGRYIMSNKFLRIYYIGLIIMHITNTTQTVIAYFALNNLGNENLTSVLFAIVMLPALVIALLLPKLTRYIDRFRIFLFSAICGGVLCVISFFAGYQNLTLFFILFAIRGIFMGTMMLTQLMFTGDIVEYGEYKTGKRLQGTAYSIQTFTFKLFNAVAAAGAMFVLGAFDFIEGAGAVQSAVTLNTIWILFSLFPVFGLVLSLPIMFRYKLRDKDVQLMAMVNNGELAREEAKKQFINDYGD